MNAKNIFLIERNPDYRSVLALNIYAYTNRNIIFKKSLDNLQEELKLHRPRLVLIHGEKSEKFDIGMRVYDSMREELEQTKVLLLGKSQMKHQNIEVLGTHVSVQKLIKKIADTYEVTAAEMSALEWGSYFPLPISFLVSNWKTPTHLYRKTNEGFVLFKRSGSVFTEDDLFSLVASNNNEIYIHPNQRLAFINSLTEEILGHITDPEISLVERSIFTERGYALVSELTHKCGVTEKTVETTEACIETMVQIVKTIPKLNTLLEDFTHKSESYKFTHSLVTNFIGAQILMSLPWGNKEQVEKLTYLSFFHDIVLPEDSWTKFDSDEAVDKSQLSPEDKKLVKCHAHLAAKLVSQFPQIPLGVDTLIKQHHGSKKGNTLSKLSLSISPLSIVFILAEEWATLVLDAHLNDQEYNKDKVIKYLHRKYNSAAFNKILPRLHLLDI